MATNNEKRSEPGIKPAYTIAEVGALLQVHRATVSAYIKSGELRVARLGHRTIRITHEALMDFLRSREEYWPTRKERQEKHDA
jgi:excisionase family DNA binding protein